MGKQPVATALSRCHAGDTKGLEACKPHNKMHNLVINRRGSPGWVHIICFPGGHCWVQVTRTHAKACLAISDPWLPTPQIGFSVRGLYSCLQVCLEVSQGALARTVEDEVSKKAREMTEWPEHRELSSMDS